MKSTFWGNRARRRFCPPLIPQSPGSDPLDPTECDVGCGFVSSRPNSPQIPVLQQSLHTTNRQTVKGNVIDGRNFGVVILAWVHRSRETGSCFTGAEDRKQSAPRQRGIRSPGRIQGLVEGVDFEVVVW